MPSKRRDQLPATTPPATDTSETHVHSEIVELGPLRAEIEVRSETLEHRIARLQRRDPSDD